MGNPTSNPTSTQRSLKKKTGAPARDETQAAAAVLLRVHLWSRAGAPMSTVPPLAAAMVEDLLSDSRCEVRKSDASAVDSVFSNTPEAVHAARRIGLLLRTFCSASEAGFLDGCMTLSNAVDPAPALDIPLLLQTHILESTLPGQVLVVGTLCEAAKQVPGLRFSELSGGVVRLPQGASANKVIQLMPSIGMEETDGRRIAFRPARAKPASQPVETEPVTMPVRVTMPVTNNTLLMPALTSQIAATPTPAPVARPVPGPSLLSQIKTASQRLIAKGHRIGGRKTRVTAFAAVAVLVVGIVISVVYPRIFARPAVATTLAKSQDTSPAPTVSDKSTHEVTPPHTTDADVPLKAKDPGPSVPAKNNKANSHTKVATDEDGAEVDQSGKKTVSRGGFDFRPEDIDRLIANADKESGDGQFDAAITNYRIVLRHDPKNGKAKQGLDRALRNKGN